MLRRNKTIENSDLLEEIWRNNKKEHEVEQELQKEDGLVWEQNKIIYMVEQIYIPSNRKIKEWILQKNHNPVDVGYLRQQRMMELVKRNY